MDLKRDKYDPVFLPKFEQLETLAFIPNKENMILLGTSGAGKTHLAIAWEEVFKDPTLTGTLIHHLAHKAHVMDISRKKGGRFEEAIAWLEESKL